MIEGASTVEDLTPRDSTASISRAISQIILSSDAFAIDAQHVVVASGKGVRRYPLAKDTTRLEAVLGALQRALEDL